MIGLIFVGDLKYCPYLDNYTKYLDEYQIEYEVLYWERSGISEQKADNYMPFKFKSELNQTFYQKITGFIKFRRWLKKRIRKEKYTKLILLSTLSGMIIPDILMKYKGDYIFDIRDYSYESVSLFKKIEKILIDNSYFTAISSPKFKDFLPESNKYILNHNFNLDIKTNEAFVKTDQNQLNFVWAGVIRYLEHQKNIIDRLGNDERFNIIYHGIGPDYEALKKYSEDAGIYNVKFTGVYLNKDKVKILKNADILNNSYDNESPIFSTKYAVSNTFYDGIVFKIPQLVETNSYKEKLVEEYKIGIALDVYSKDFANELFSYYHKIDENVFNINAEKLYGKHTEEQMFYYSKIKDFIKM